MKLTTTNNYKTITNARTNETKIQCIIKDAEGYGIGLGYGTTKKEARANALASL